MNALALLSNLSTRGIMLIPDGDALIARPRQRLTDADREAIRRHKSALLAHLSAEDARAEALAVLQRLKAFTLPTGRMAAAHLVAQRLASTLSASKPGENREDATAILHSVRALEGELIALGGTYDADLAGSISRVESVFPGANLVEVKKT
jgi:hypothetical protein